MKQFLKSTLAVVLGCLIFSLLFIFIAIGIISSVGGEKTESLKSNSILMLKFNNPIPDLKDNVETEPSKIFSEGETLGLMEVLKSIEHASNDPKIKGILLEPELRFTGWATIASVRTALEKFKEKGKFIYAFTNAGWGQSEYYLASVADKIYMNPMGSIDLHGFGVEIDFVKGTLDKLGVKANVFYAGKFKSATEMFRRTDMSPENKIQMRELLTEFHKNYVEAVGKSRKLTPAQLNDIFNSLGARNANLALKNGIIDRIAYKDQLIDDLKEKLGVKPEDDIKSKTLEEYFEATNPMDYGKGSEVAVVYAEGSIVDDSEESSTIGGEQYCKILRKIRKEKEAKAVVLRVNSGGGSALASEMIWRECERLKAAGIPVVVSMGNYAASGGYYISAGANRVFAEPNTITGSIGVFGMIPNIKGLMTNTLGVTVDTVKTTKFGISNPVYFDFNTEEAAMMQESVDTIYNRFKSVVASGRKMDLNKVEEVAQGRVWTGRKALELKLVDELGSLNDAIKHAAKLAGIGEKYSVNNFPKQEDGMTKIFKKFGLKTSIEAMVAQQLGLPKPNAEVMYYLTNHKSIQAKLPFNISIK
jgi:protease-4